MRRVAPSVIAREELHRLLAGGADREANIVSALVEAVTRLVVAELLEAEQGDSWVAAAGMSAEARVRSGHATAMSRGGFVPRRDRSRSPCRRCVAQRRRSARR